MFRGLYCKWGEMVIKFFNLWLLFFVFKTHDVNASTVQHNWVYDFSKLKIGSKDVGDKIQAHAEEDSKKIRDYCMADPSATTNLATVRVYFITTANPRPQEHVFRRIFLSKWRIDSGALLKKIRDTFVGYETLNLGDLYPSITTKILNQEPSKMTQQEKKLYQTLEDDFKDRGRKLKDNVSFSHSSYDHSEQAFLSCIYRENCKITGKKPTLIVLSIVSRHPACSVCGPTLKEILKNKDRKKKFIKKLFPNIDNPDIPLSIIYTSADLEPLGVDIDFSVRGPYLMDARK